MRRKIGGPASNKNKLKDVPAVYFKSTNTRFQKAGLSGVPLYNNALMVFPVSSSITSITSLAYPYL